LTADAELLQPVCPPSARPERLFDPASGVHGLRGAQTRVAGSQRVVVVWLYQAPPAELADAALWSLEPAPGGTQVAVVAAALVAAPAPHVELELAGLPDPGRYRLAVEPPIGVAFDPLRTWLPVRLRPECQDLGSCFAVTEPAALPALSPVRDYLARDWRALRRALVEHLLEGDPGADVSIADPTITLIELFAHVGDVLGYRLDRVASEAYLETARERTSIRRHARLVDFAVGDGVAAETAVHVVVSPGAPPVAVQAGSVAVDAPGSDLAFTLEAPLTADAAVGEIPIYDWGEEACCLPAGATECVLVRPQAADPLADAWLAPGGLLAFEVVDPDDEARHRSWARRLQLWPTDADGVARFRDPLPSRAAQVVELTLVEPFSDPLLGAGLALYRVHWRPEDALVRAYPVGIDTSAGGAEVTVARANLVPAHHGRLVDGPPGATLAPRLPDWADPETAPPVEFSLIAAGSPATGGRAGGPGLSIAAARAPERPETGPHRLDVSVLLPSGLTVSATMLRSLLDATGAELSVVVDVEEHEPPILRFKTGSIGQAPPLGSRVSAAYEVGGGARGNVPANALRILEENASGAGEVPSWHEIAGVAVRNPMPAAGGEDPTPLDTVRRDAPEAFAVEPRRAVLPADHAEAAARSPLVERAMAQRSWSGSWPVIATVVDLVSGGSESDEGARAELQAQLDDLRMLGTEVAVVSGTPVGLYVALEVCARPGADPGELRGEILGVLRPGPDDRPGLFHPSRLQLGSAVYLSTVVAAVAALARVDAVAVHEARRLSEPPRTVHEVITFGPDEVAVLDDDPARPARGRLDVQVLGA
jgi:predicted phage baseplate assembly protein